MNQHEVDARRLLEIAESISANAHQFAHHLNKMRTPSTKHPQFPVYSDELVRLMTEIGSMSRVALRKLGAK